MDRAAMADMILMRQSVSGSTNPGVARRHSRGRADVHAEDAINSEATHSRQSMRAFLSALREAGQLASIAQPIQLDYEIAGCLAEIDSGPALHFTNIEAASGPVAMPVVGNLLNSLPRFALGVSTTVDQIQASLLAAIEKPLPHRVLSSGPCQEEIVADPSLAEELPIPRFFEKEGGAYVTAGAIVAKDRVTGDTNLSIARLMPLGGNRAFVGIAPNHHLAVLARAAHARGEETGYRGLHWQPSRGSGRGLSLSRAWRG